MKPPMQREGVSGETFAAQVKSDIEQRGLAAVVSVQYMRGQDAMRIKWTKSGLVLDFPASAEWVENIDAVLSLYAQARLIGIPE